ncbi:olfactory receptor 1019-like [Spea bombifrons]|uniref:olfactory receptor 1019-like n=1 Tax=Spea bombifrons TaxID=233779 RepID=UPI00234A4181|nr:olfactory receptor 1019-like [Spea bombifrons]
MYFFLCNLSALDIVYTSVTSPKLIYVFATNSGNISFKACIVQLYFFIAFGSTEYLLLTLMSYDRYLAICKPLHYTLIMNKKVRTLGATSTWLGGLLAAFPIVMVTTNLKYCSSKAINHFFCDITALIKISCGDTTVIHIVILIQGVILVMSSFLLTLLSYICIISSILKIRTSKGKRKAFATCASHLTTVSAFYCLIFELYMKSKSSISLNEGKVLTVLYVYVIPMLNPMVYSFRNRDVRLSLRKIIHH